MTKLRWIIIYIILALCIGSVVGDSTIEKEVEDEFNQAFKDAQNFLNSKDVQSAMRTLGSWGTFGPEGGPDARSSLIALSSQNRPTVRGALDVLILGTYDVANKYGVAGAQDVLNAQDALNAQDMLNAKGMLNAQGTLFVLDILSNAIDQLEKNDPNEQNPLSGQKSIEIEPEFIDTLKGIVISLEPLKEAAEKVVAAENGPDDLEIADIEEDENTVEDDESTTDTD